MKIVGDFNPRGNVHTFIEVNSDMQKKSLEKQEKPKFEKEKRKIFDEKRESKKMDRKKSSNEPFFSKQKLQSKKPEIRKNKQK